MRVAVHNDFWSTAGGGERFAAGIAEVLAERHEVDLLSSEPLDLDWLGERLRLDLSGVGVRLVGHDPWERSEVTADYDLFVNPSFGSELVNRARAGLYVVHFPVNGMLRWPEARLPARRGLRPLLDRLPTAEVGEGFHHQESGGGVARWTDGDGALLLRPPCAPVARLRLLHAAPAEVGPTKVQVLVDGHHALDLELPPAPERGEPGATEVAIELPGGGAAPVEVRVVSDAFVPAELGRSDDSRRLGVFVVDLDATPERLRPLRRVVERAAGPARYLPFLDSYPMVASNSAFTATWVRRRWGRRSVVVYPPAAEPAEHVAPAHERDRVVLSVGRFFTPERGHAKKQLEMVEAFGRLHRSGGAEGWEYHLVGGCAEPDRPYLERVARAAEGLPVHLHVGAPGAVLSGLYRRASLFWHLTGYGEDARRHPDRLEHFGITTVEAMAAGLVPVVFAAGGQREIVEEAISGFQVRTPAELVARTRELVGHPALRERMAQRAVERARWFSRERFAERLLAAVELATSGGRT